jgi:peptide-methionine (R)-S-oxide reductase
MSLAANDGPVSTVDPHGKPYAVQHTDAEWRKILSKEAFEILRRAGTEPSYSSDLLNEHRKGVFVCAGCGQKLFESNTKFDSGTGWPSFYQPIKGGIVEQNDYSDGTQRTEVLCAHCGGHLGHVFDDGPQPTGLRFCMDGVALKFVPETTVKR